jgi:hypothetical protein
MIEPCHFIGYEVTVPREDESEREMIWNWCCENIESVTWKHPHDVASITVAKIADYSAPSKHVWRVLIPDFKEALAFELRWG